MSNVILLSYRSVHYLEFELGPFTVLFGKNNAGKTNLLEAIYGVLAPQDMPTFVASNFSRPVPGLRGGEGYLPPVGAVYVELEQGLAFDDAVLAMVPEAVAVQDGVLRFREVPPGHVWFANNSASPNRPGLWFVDARDYFGRTHANIVRTHANMIKKRDNEQRELDDEFELLGLANIINKRDNEQRELDDQFDSLRINGPRPRPLFLGWEFEDVDSWVTSAIAELTAVPSKFDGEPRSVALLGDDEPDGLWCVNPEVLERLEQLALLATDLLPDFIDGSIQPEFRVPTGWENSPRVWLYYEERSGGKRRFLEDFGRGASRWMAVAVQVALRVMEEDPQITALDVTGPKAFSGQVLFVDEPEAHLHPSAVASVVRWCQRMVSCGFSVVAASHHEAFLRASSDEVTFVKVSRDVESSCTTARTLLSAATPLLQELATEVGMHPAIALSLQRAILFVEGPLDAAVLDEYAGPQFDAAGVLIIPIHGTKNLEGLIDGEFTTRLDIKTGVLTDNTITATIWDRSNTKRSREEIRVTRLIRRFEDQGRPPPELFGVPEDDLLFALPPEGIRQHFPTSGSQFPGWVELREECRQALGKGTSDSVDWKAYAEEHYDLPLTTEDGVRSVVHRLDLAGVQLPSIRAVVDDVIAWARQDRGTA
jgi:energy-coupling factor transporter ATP-binding protein EcfA2